MSRELVSDVATAMSCGQFSPQELTSCLSHRPRYTLNGMISISVSAAEPSAIQGDSSSSSIGLLDTLPLELLHSIFNMLDFRSLSRLSLVSIRGKVLIKSPPTYQNLIEHALRALTALCQTRIISLFSVVALHATLRSEQCISCGEYGAFLLLPTCERCCYECLCRNPSFGYCQRPRMESASVSHHRR